MNDHEKSTASKLSRGSKVERHLEKLPLGMHIITSTHVFAESIALFTSVRQICASLTEQGEREDGHIGNDLDFLQQEKRD